MPRLAAITYDGLPISSGGAHQLRTRGFVETSQSMARFVSSVCVDSTPVKLSLELINGGDVDEKEFSRLRNDTCEHYGLKKLTRGLGDYVGHQWSLDVNTLHETAVRLEELRPISIAGYAGWQVVLHATWELKFRENDSQLPIPHQTRQDYNEFETGWRIFLGESGLYARISEKSTAAIYLSLPFEDASAECRRLASRIQDAFPVRFSTKHWKRWSLTKAGNSYVGRKIDSPIVG